MIIQSTFVMMRRVPPPHPIGLVTHPPPPGSRTPSCGRAPSRRSPPACRWSSTKATPAAPRTRVRIGCGGMLCDWGLQLGFRSHGDTRDATVVEFPPIPIKWFSSDSPPLDSCQLVLRQYIPSNDIPVKWCVARSQASCAGVVFTRRRQSAAAPWSGGRWDATTWPTSSSPCSTSHSATSPSRLRCSPTSPLSFHSHFFLIAISRLPPHHLNFSFFSFVFFSPSGPISHNLRPHFIVLCVKLSVIIVPP